MIYFVCYINKLLRLFYVSEELIELTNTHIAISAVYKALCFYFAKNSHWVVYSEIINDSLWKSEETNKFYPQNS